MARRSIGIDYDGRTLRVAVASREKGETILRALLETPCEHEKDIPSKLKGLLGEPAYGDHCAMALDARLGLTRRLRFPFADRRKIAAAVEYELSAQIPVPIDEHAVAFAPPEKGARGEVSISAAAVPSSTVRSRLSVFDDTSFPLHSLGMAPFTFLPLCPADAEFLLAAVGEKETTLSLIRQGDVVDYRLLPLGADVETAARFILREAGIMERGARCEELPVSLIGSGATPPLIEACRKGGRIATVPEIPCDGKLVPPSFLPAAALALGGMAGRAADGLDFRKGEFALRSEWNRMRKSLVAGGVLLLLSMVLFAVSTGVDYASKTSRAEALRKEIVRLYRESFPGATVIVDPTRQMESGVRELREKVLLLGAGREDTPLAILTEISSIPEDIPATVRDFFLDGDTARIEGTAPAFDAVNRIADFLKSSPLFREVQLAEAKTSLDGSRVDFRIHITLRTGGSP